MKEYGLQYEQTTLHLGTKKEKTTLTDTEKPK